MARAPSFALCLVCASAPAAAQSLPVALAVPGWRDAVMVEPADLTTAHPVLLVAHGNFDRPDWQCRVWARIVAGRAFVVCPRGVPRRESSARDPRFTYANDVSLGRELDAALAALRARYGDAVDVTSPGVAGFSLGAEIASPWALSHHAAFAVYVEGGLARWDRARARRFTRAGVGGVLFACGHAGCVRRAREVVSLLRAEGIAAGVADGSGAGHVYWGPVAAALARQWPSLHAVAPRFVAPPDVTGRESASSAPR